MNINSKCYRCGWEFSIETDEAMPAEHVPHICATCASVINLVVHEPVPPAELLAKMAAPDVLAECTARAEYEKHVDATAAALLADVDIFN